MDRLTFEGNFCDIAMCQETPGGSFCESGSCSQRRVWERLKYYEDLEAQKRLITLPCHVGDRIFIPDISYRKVAAVRVQGISVSYGGRPILRLGGYPTGSLWGDSCGKDWFLTQEEAEAALAAQEVDHGT